MTVDTAKPVDLTRLRAPFGLLDEIYGPGTAQALSRHTGHFEIFFGEGKSPSGWYLLTSEPQWIASHCYRAVAGPVIDLPDLIANEDSEDYYIGIQSTRGWTWPGVDGYYKNWLKKRNEGIKTC